MVLLPTNKFILGPSGSGKSFLPIMVRQYYEQGAHVLLVDTGNSYQGCELIKGKNQRRRWRLFHLYEDNHSL
jgi:type IV secretory pathway VirB4 component